MTRARTGHIETVAATPAGTRGFTLIELAVALFVIVLVLGSLLVPLTTQVDQRQISDTEKTLQEIREALIGYAVANGNLPCPDTGTNGTENVTGNSCTLFPGGISCGRLPHLNLGLGNSDLWGNRFTYCVNEVYARRGAGLTFTLAGGGTDVRICTSQACTTTLSTTAVFAIISHGKNGFGAVNFTSGATNPASGSVDEQENYDTDKDVVSRPQFTGGTTASEFDDIVVWLSKYTLFNRMVSGGKLP